MLSGESCRPKYPRNPLDVLAQQLVASACMDTLTADQAFDMMRPPPRSRTCRAHRSTVCSTCSRAVTRPTSSQSSGRGITWDRVSGTLRAGKVHNVWRWPMQARFPSGFVLACFCGERTPGARRRARRGDGVRVAGGRGFVLGASSWRIQDIPTSRVEVTPAPGEPGKLPFWHGDRPAVRSSSGVRWEPSPQLAEKNEVESLTRLTRDHALDARAAMNLLAYVKEQKKPPASYRRSTLVVERFVDEVGDWRVCLLSPFGARVHAPLALATLADTARTARPRSRRSGPRRIIYRFPRADEPPDVAALVPAPDEVRGVSAPKPRQSSPLRRTFPRERCEALLLPRRYPGRRSPLLGRSAKRSADLLAVAAATARSRSCSRPTASVCGTCRRSRVEELLGRVQSRKLRVVTVERGLRLAASLLSRTSPTSSTTADAPLAERPPRR